ncbi:MAG: sugar transferase [Bacteroidales bacterium]|nr:sugar transferase [Bacteroidales bacterium]
MNPTKGTYIGNDKDFYSRLAKALPSLDFIMFPDATENSDYFRQNKPGLIVLESASCGENIAAYLDWLNKSIDPIRTIIILLTEKQNTSVYSKLLTQGVDDVYTIPADPVKLAARVQLIAEFRNTKISKAPSPEYFEYQMPFIKRAFDVALAGTALLLLSPVFLIVAILIRLESRGPVFYASKRIGTGFKTFDFYKFRSMDMNADAKIKDLKKLNQYAVNTDTNELKFDPDFSIHDGRNELFDDEGKVDEELFIKKKQQEKEVSFVKIKDDPRITKVGRFIRNSSIDELPQLINVLKGDMSIVGNRPIPLYEAELLTTDEWIERFIAPAGLTGLWQVEKRAKSTEMSPEERKQLDNEYARTYTFWKDIRIILRTFRAVFQSESV